MYPGEHTVKKGTDFTFWKNGERWIKIGGKDYRLLDLAPELETWWMMKHKAKKFNSSSTGK